jgi:hypothetical protein
MDKSTRENWQKVKTSLEQAGKTDCFFYKRACAIAAGGNDPLSHEEWGQTPPQ